MKKIIIAGFVAALVIGTYASCFASDWDKAGKILTVLEGVRVVTGGKVDLIGTVTGINRPREDARERVYVMQEYQRGPVVSDYREHGSYRSDRHFREYRRVWVPHYVWKVQYVPRHVEYRPGHHRVVVEGHYEKYKVETGGHWETRYDCD